MRSLARTVPHLSKARDSTIFSAAAMRREYLPVDGNSTKVNSFAMALEGLNNSQVLIKNKDPIAVMSHPTK